MTNKFYGLIIAGVVIVSVVLLVVLKTPQADYSAITNFDQCAAAGYPIMESYPEQCRTPDGRTFVREMPAVIDPIADLIVVEKPLSGAVVESPLVVTGRARGTWYFEASFPVTLLDANGVVLAQVPAQAQSDWMTTEFVPFSATLKFNQPATPTGVLVLKNDNPSGEPSRDKEIRIPVRFTQLPALQSGSFGKATTLNLDNGLRFSDGLTVRLTRINDSRCKPNVQCIWSGELQAVIDVAKGSATQEVLVGTVNAQSVAVLGYTIALQSATEKSATIVVTVKQGTPSGTSGINGYVHLGPICPVERMPPDPNCADKPFASGVVEIRSTSGGTLVKKLNTDAQGAFSAVVAPGSYTIKVKASSGAMLPSCAEVPAVVKSGNFTNVDVSCDSGIR